jgi:hypothetical protein
MVGNELLLLRRDAGVVMLDGDTLDCNLRRLHRLAVGCNPT